MPLNGYGHMVLDHYVAQVRAVHAARTARLRAVTTRRDAEAYQRAVRAAIDRAFRHTAPLPSPFCLRGRVGIDIRVGRFNCGIGFVLWHRLGDGNVDERLNGTRRWRRSWWRWRRVARIQSVGQSSGGGRDEKKNDNQDHGFPFALGRYAQPW